ncbi:MAG: serine/threonine-protein kinase [Streptomycetaceae bacterium]|nr:MAG: serine/threonine-protein kinase [Streptomycetaceae bacterium]
MINSLLGGRYKLGEMIGTGGMADVYVAQDTRLARQVAVKVLRSDLARDPSFVARFRKEALAAAGLNHPGIVAVYDSGEEPAPYIVMELVSGHTLRELIHKGERVPLKRTLEIGEGILAALEYSHERGIVHRDIKPANIMITDQGDVKVMDFGIARALADLGATLTNTWNIVGTAQYLSPEQALGEVADLRSDIYSTGCLLYEVLTGKPPFTGETPVSIAYQHVSGVLISPSALVPDLPAGIDVILSVALAKKPEDRYQSAGLMLDDLYKIAAGQVLTTKAPRVKISRRKILITALASLVAITTVGAALLLTRPSSDVATFPQIPNVVGLSQADAEAMLSDYVVTIARAHDARIPKDRVASQIPLATTRAQKGSGVVLTISDGPGDAIVPVDLIGMSLADARAALAAVGLLVTQTEAVPSDEPLGTVLKVTPEVGSTITAGSGVLLQIASGQVEVPALIGVDAIQAKTILVQVGFLVNEIDAYDANQPVGVVIRQAPDAGTTQTIGKSVTITINKAP